MNLKDIISTKPSEQRKSKSLEFIDRFSSSSAENRYILGINVFTDALLDIYDVRAIIDDAKPHVEYREIPVINFADFNRILQGNGGNPESMLVLSVAGGKPRTALRKLNECGVSCLDYFNFKHFSNLDLPELPMNENFEVEFTDNVKKFEWVYELLEDEKSKNNYLKILKFRLEYDLEELKIFADNQANQYFESFLEIGEHPAFLDIGCFDLKTTLKFMENYPNYATVIAIEPDRRNYQICKETIESLNLSEEVKVYNLGFGSIQGISRIIGNGSTANLRASDRDEQDVENGHHLQRKFCEVTTIDKFGVPERSGKNKKINWLIKMDIEGMELDAINGGRETIKNLRPTLAICVYHKPSDLWRIAEQVLNISNEYKVYFRHYTESIYESVMFFVPYQSALRTD